MEFYLPTRDECQALTKTSEAFYCTTRNVEGQIVEMYDYRLAGYTDFFPEDGKNWTELRGLTFVQQADWSWGRNILLQKFFNINQTTNWLYEDVKGKAITRVQNKEDGSIISFVKFANDRIRAKSKMSFESPQAVMAQEVYDNDQSIKQFIQDIATINATCIWELCSPDNQIVLEYPETKLILLQIRFSNGTYMCKSGMLKYANHYNITTANDFELIAEDGVSILDNLLDVKEYSQEAIEGWVVTFEDGQMAKIKTDKYLQLHGLIGPDAFRENLLVQTILEGNIDDVIAALAQGTKKDKLVELTSKVESNFNHLVVEFKELRRKYFQDFKEVRKDFAIKHSKDRLFSGVIRTLGTSFRDVEQTAEQAVKAYILKQCDGLNDAKAYLKEL